jgi:hypothetical protein
MQTHQSAAGGEPLRVNRKPVDRDDRDRRRDRLEAGLA